jgi:hypothetical protein
MMHYWPIQINSLMMSKRKNIAESTLKRQIRMASLQVEAGVGVHPKLEHQPNNRQI